MKLKTNLTPAELLFLIKDTVVGNTSNYSFIDNPDIAYVSTHEVDINTANDIAEFSDNFADLLTQLLNSKNVFISPARYSEPLSLHPEYSTFISLFTAQLGIVRILWLNNKILSILIGSKLTKISSSTTKNENITYAPTYFGFSEGSEADLGLSTEDKVKLMSLPKVSWFVSDKTNLSPKQIEANKSLSISKNYIRYGMIEKFVESDDINFLVYPKDSNNFFSQGSNGGTGLPILTKLISNFNIIEVLNNTLVEGEWNSYREYSNSIFMFNKDVITNCADEKKYIKFSYNSMIEFINKEQACKPKDLIKKKYAILTEEDIKKYQDNPRYNMIYSNDNLLFYITKSDKLKATALQTKITKSLREDFISFLNWIGVLQLAADLVPGNMVDSFRPHFLQSMSQATWSLAALNTLRLRKAELVSLATEQYRILYMGDSTNIIATRNNYNIFETIFTAYTIGTRHNPARNDPRQVLQTANSVQPFSFNKKFSLEFNLANVLAIFAKGGSSTHDDDRIWYTSTDSVLSFLNTNFLLSDKVEKAFESILTAQSQYYGNRSWTSTARYNFQYQDDISQGQLMKTCISLSPEALTIFNSVANLTTPTDILSWLELSKEHFTQVLPQLLVNKYSNIGVNDVNQLSALITISIEYYMTLLQSAEPFSNKLLSPDDSSDETGE